MEVLEESETMSWTRDFEKLSRIKENQRASLKAYLMLKSSGRISSDGSVISESAVNHLRHKPYRLDWGERNENF